jgi:hypothetical protein
MSTTWEEGGRQGGIESAREVVEGSRIYTTIKHALYLTAYSKLSFISFDCCLCWKQGYDVYRGCLIVVLAAICRNTLKEYFPRITH